MVQTNPTSKVEGESTKRLRFGDHGIVICVPRSTVRLSMAETLPDSSLASFDKPINALVVGANGGLGRVCRCLG